MVKKIIIYVLISVLFFGLLIGGAYFILKRQGVNVISKDEGNIFSKSDKSKSANDGRTNLGNGIYLTKISSNYKKATDKTLGNFQNGQNADILLSGIDFNNSGGPLLFNHPGNVASNGQKLFLADRNNNRILIWNSLPSSNSKPDLVLGQKDFIANNPGASLNQMNWPVCVATDGTRLFVCDTYNDRVLIWNKVPTENGQSADFALSTIGWSLDKRGAIVWPWAAWSNGQKLVITSTGSGQVLIWNKVPTSNKRADIVLKLEGKFGTPRSIGSDGTNLVIGDHNALGSNKGNFFWKSFPTEDDQMYNFFMPNFFLENYAKNTEVFWGMNFLPDGQFLAMTNQIGIWNKFPEDENDAPDVIVGSSGAPQDEEQYKFWSGDGSGVAYAAGKLYVSASNGNKIVVYNSLPTKPTDKPSLAIGSPDINTNTLETNFIMSNPVPASDNASLFISSDFDSKLYVYKNLPDQSGAHPNLVYDLPDAPWDNALWKNTLALAGKQTVFIWTESPAKEVGPSRILKNQIGNVALSDIKGVAIDDQYFYLSDENANKVYIWEGVPSENDNPKFILNINKPCRLTSDGNYLVINSTNIDQGGAVHIFKVDELSNEAQPVSLGKAYNRGRFNLPQGSEVKDNKLFVADTGFNRLLIWNNIEEAISGKAADTVFGYSGDISDNPDAAKPQIGQNQLFWPSNVYFDGNYLWLGEFKFSERVLRFSPH